jgi:hypothetical protein
MGGGGDTTASGGSSGTGGLTGSGGAGTGGLTGSGGAGTGGLTGSGGAGTGGLTGSGGAGTGGLTGSGGAGTGGLTGLGGAGTGGLTGSGGAVRTGGVVAAGGRGGTGGIGTGGTLGSGGTEGPCTSVSPCGGDVVGTWNVVSSCLPLSGEMDVTLLSLGCSSLPVTGALQVTGTWTAKPNGTYVDNTTTTGGATFPLSSSCLTVSSVSVECSRMASVFTAVGWSAATCASDAGGKCNCSVKANQTGGLGVVSPWASNEGTYRTSGNGLTIDDSVDYTYCVSGNTLALTPKPTILPATGVVQLQRMVSSGTGGARGR